MCFVFPSVCFLACFYFHFHFHSPRTPLPMQKPKKQTWRKKEGRHDWFLVELCAWSEQLAG